MKTQELHYNLYTKFLTITIMYTIRLLTIEKMTTVNTFKFSGIPEYKYLILILFLVYKSFNLSGQCTISFQPCPSEIILVDCDNSGDEKIEWPLVIANPAGFCTSFTLVQTTGPVQGTIVPLGQYIIGYIAQATDINTQSITSVSCQFFVKVVKDNQPPTFTSCPTNITINGTLDAFGNCNLPAYWANPLAFDNCNHSLSTTVNFPCGSIFPLGTTTVIYTTSDASGNTASCSFTVTISCPNATDGSTPGLEELNLFPNPTSDVLTIDLQTPASFEMTISVIDVTGRVVFERPCLPNMQIQNFDLTNIPNGLYFLYLKTSEQNLAFNKFVKQ